MLNFTAVRERWSSFLGTFIALTLGVGLLGMTGLIMMSAEVQVPRQYAGTPVLVQSNDGPDPANTFAESAPFSPERTSELEKALASVPGVERVVAERSFYAQAVIDGKPVGDPPAGQLSGHGWSSAALAPLKLTAGKAPGGPDEVVVDRALGVAPGNQLTLLTAAGPTPYTVSGTVDGPGFFLTDDAAAAKSGGVRVLGLLTAKGADTAAVEAAAAKLAGKDGTAVSGAARTSLEARFDERTRWIGSQVLGAMAALAGFVTIFVVASTFAFSVVQRRREFGMLRTIGATPKQIRRMMYGEALTIGIIGAGAGAVLGAVLAPLLSGVLVDSGFEPRGFTTSIDPLPLVGAFLAGLAVAMLGVWAASRRAAKVRPLEALRDAAVEKKPMTRGRWIAALVFTGLGLLMAAGTASSSADDMVTFALFTAMALIVGLTLLAPAVIPLVIKAVSVPLTRGSGATGTLVREGTLSAVRRTASTAAPVLATIGFAVLITGMVQTTAASYAAKRTASVTAQAVVTPNGTPGLSDSAVEAVEGTGLLKSVVYVKDALPLDVAGVDPVAFAKANERLKPVSGDFAALTGPESIAVSVNTAAQQGWSQDGTAAVTLPDGTTRKLRVVAVVPEEAAPYGALLNRTFVREHDPSALTEAVYRTGSTAPKLDSAFGAQEVSTSTFAKSADAEEDELVWIFTVVLIAVSVGYTGIAIGNTLMMATADRARDFRVLRLSGATTRQVLWVVAGETAFVVGIGSVLGVAVALPTLFGIRAGLADKIGTAVELVIPWGTISLVILACLALATTASVLPARAALRGAAGARA